MRPVQKNIDIKVKEGADAVRKAFGADLPKCAVILGSGLSSVAASIAMYELPYPSIPGMLHSQVEGHEGLLRLGKLNNNRVLFFCGRSHFYEGHDMPSLGIPVRIAYELGVDTIISCCAVGSLRTDIVPGTIVSIRDHLNTIGINPLRGTNPPQGKPFFVDPGKTYDQKLIDVVLDSQCDLSCPVTSGVYAWVSGPSYETPAESAMLAQLGADVVGMSLVPESLTARQLEMSVAGLCCVTNFASGIGNSVSGHDDVLKVAKSFIDSLRALISILQ